MIDAILTEEEVGEIAGSRVSDVGSDVSDQTDWGSDVPGYGDEPKNKWIPITQEPDKENDGIKWKSETYPKLNTPVWLHYMEAGIEKTELAYLDDGGDGLYWMRACGEPDTNNIIMPSFDKYDQYIAWCEAVAPEYPGEAK